MRSAGIVIPSAWLWSEEHRQPCQVIEGQSLRGGTVYRIPLPEPDAVVRLPAERLTTLARAGTVSSAHLTYLAAAAQPHPGIHGTSTVRTSARSITSSG